MANTKAVAPIEVSMTTKQKLSVAVGVLSLLAFLISNMKGTWGFGGWSDQFVETMLAVSGAITIYFGCSTVQKHQDEKESS